MRGAECATTRYDVTWVRKHTHMYVQVGNSISAELLAKCEDLGILVDKDDRGVLLQIFTKPLGAPFVLKLHYMF